MMFPAIIFLWISILFISTSDAAEFRTHYCELNTSSYINTTTNFYSNLIQVLDSLANDSTVINKEKFLNNSRGTIQPDIAYGLYLCRADTLPNDCRNCLLRAREDLNNTCPLSKAAVAWSDDCMLRYANYSISSVMNSETFIPECNKINITQEGLEQKRFWRVAIEFVRKLAKRRSFDKDLFAYDEVSYNHTFKVYAYVQCTPDLSRPDCNKCLETSIDRLTKYCYGRQGARVLAASCNVRFEIYRFLEFKGDSPEKTGRNNIRTKTITAIVAIVGFLSITAAIWYLFVSKRRLRHAASSELNYEETGVNTDESEMITEQSLQFDLNTIEEATNNFSSENRIGEGGFGVVYKGILANGDVIAVKRLSKGSGQGSLELKNEVVLLAKLQHRNLVRLLGFCIHGEEKILIYEYVANQSLDFFLFGRTETKKLDWSTRYKIIRGIARGMLYLHEDSRLKIIHRDLKTSNILLDEEMNAKISDFGMARIVCGSQIHEVTNRIVGTLGYMSPEYAMHGHFSVKSDVFSFGVLVFEILTGKKNTRFFQSSYTDLPCYAWSKWKNGQPLEILDSNLIGCISDNEALRCIHIALLCVQEDDELRPSMALVVLMLSSSSMALPVPQNPPFVSRKRLGNVTSSEVGSNSNTYTIWPTDTSLITNVHPR